MKIDKLIRSIIYSRSRVYQYTRIACIGTIIGLISTIWFGSVMAQSTIGWIGTHHIWEGTYSPTALKPSMGHSNWNPDSNSNNGTQWFSDQLSWDLDAANGVRDYSNNRRFFSQSVASTCLNCLAYYTHDFRDLDDQLDAAGYATNFPDPKIDFEDDGNDGREEEAEVVVLNQDFPRSDRTYYFKVWFEWKRYNNDSCYFGSNCGLILHQPAVSALNAPIVSEYNTMRRDHPFIINYWDVDPHASLVSSASTTSPKAVGASFQHNLVDEVYGFIVKGHHGSEIVNVHINTALRTPANLETYKQWAIETAIPNLEKVQVPKALTSITFHKPISKDIVSGLLTEADNASVTAIRSVSTDINNLDSNSNTWTIQLEIPKGRNYNQMLDEFIGLMQQEHNDELDLISEGRAVLPDEDEDYMSLDESQIVAITAWLPLDQVKTLNKNPNVFLADPSASYLRLLVANDEELQQLQASHVTSSNVNKATMLEDGFSIAISTPTFSDVYAELQLTSELAKNSTTTGEDAQNHNIYLPLISY